MKNKKFTIRINKPVSEVFAFTLNPQNTPKWIESIVQEEVNEYPTKQGTKYRNQNKEGKWSEYIVTEFEKDKMFTWIKDDKSYFVRYSFTPTDDNSTELEYEWPDKGKVDKSFIQEILDKLKHVLEKE